MTHTTPGTHEPPPGSHYQPAIGVVLVIVVLFVAATFFMLRTSTASPSATATTTTTTVPHSAVKHPAKAKVRVQVANGTDITGLGRTYTQQLQTIGWDTLPPVNSNSKATASVIYFNPGFAWAGREIAIEIKVSPSVVEPLNGLSPVPGAAGDDVIVVLGPDVAIKG